jgi:hypothetical protein
VFLPNSRNGDASAVGTFVVVRAVWRYLELIHDAPVQYMYMAGPLDVSRVNRYQAVERDHSQTLIRQLRRSDAVIKGG